MRERGTLYLVIGQIVEVVPANGRKFELEELQKYVGGHIELVPGTARRGNPAAYCNEEGLLQGKPFNVAASLRFGQSLVGDVLQVRKEKQ